MKFFFCLSCCAGGQRRRCCAPLTRREHRARRVVARKAGLAHARAVVDDQRCAQRGEPTSLPKHKRRKKIQNFSIKKREREEKACGGLGGGRAARTLHFVFHFGRVERVEFKKGVGESSLKTECGCFLRAENRVLLVLCFAELFARKANRGRFCETFPIAANDWKVGMWWVVCVWDGGGGWVCWLVVVGWSSCCNLASCSVE